MDPLDSLLEKYGFVKRLKVDYNYQQIESFIGFPLPTDYKYYLENYEPYDGFVGDESIVIYGFTELFPYNNSLYTDENLPRTLLVGSNGASENMGLRFIDKNNYQIVIAQYLSDIDDHIEIGDSFTDMLARLDSGQNWFN